MGKDWYEGCIDDREWRLNHLYYIQNKDGGIQRFRMNWAQRELFEGVWTRNAILKVRQLGISTFVELLGLDCCLFNRGFQMGIIDKTMTDAKSKLLKMKQAYEWMLYPPSRVAEDHVGDPEDREKVAKLARAVACGDGDPNERAAKFKQETATFENGSSVRIGVSLRGGTLQLLHVSELASVAHNFPRRAQEIISGGINAVGKDCIVISESTHEGGKYGEHYRLVKAAMENQGKELDKLDFAFYFFPWWRQEEYALPESATDTSELAEYWLEMEEKGIALTEGQKRWYYSMWKTMGPAMKREYPSTADEALANQISGAIYGGQIERLRAEGKLSCEFECDSMHPIYTAWDLGMGDYTAIWLIQPGGDGRYYVLDYYCANKAGLDFYFNKVREWERKYQLVTRHFLPFDAEASTSRVSTVTAAQYFAAAQMPYSVVPRPADIWHGIYAVRDLLPRCIFHQRCNNSIIVDTNEYMSGIDALEGYKTGGTTAGGVERSAPLHDACSHGADAFRYFAQAVASGMVGREDVRRREAGNPLLQGRRKEAEQQARASGTPWWKDATGDMRVREEKRNTHGRPNWW